MDKGLLFQFMRVKFREAGFPQAEVDLHMQSFTERYQNQTDEEIEADIRRRGGPTRIAAATIERRNTVLMADDDYRAFVESAKEADGASDAEEPSEEIRVAAPHGDGEAEQPAQDPSKENDEDPLAAWLTIAENKPVENTKTEDDIPPLFSEPETDIAEEQDEHAATAEVPAVHAAEKEPQVQQIREEMQAKQPRPTPQRVPVTPRPVSDADMGRTKVLQVPTAVPTGVQQSQAPAQNIPMPQKPAQTAEAYQKEQAAIWGASSGDVRDGKNGAPVQRKAPAQNPAAQHASAQKKPAAQKPAEKKNEVEYADRGTVTRLQEKTYWGAGSEEGVKRFRIILAVSVPFVAVLLLAYAVLALGLIAVMAVLIAAFIVGLVAEVAVGSLIALVAVIYGISQTFLVLPVGLFELGLGIAAIGVTIFVGILMYNIAVRLLPFLLKRFIEFQSVFKGFLQDLYYYVKGECYRR